METITVSRPWGSFERITHNKLSTVKVIYVNKGEQLSLQYHNHRDEFWKVLLGTPVFTIGDDMVDSKVGDEYQIPAKKQHRISAPNDDVVILEVATGDFDEDDIVRLEDKYNRA